MDCVRKNDGDSWIEGETERQMIGWEERGSVDGSEERRWVTGLLEGSICK